MHALIIEDEPFVALLIEDHLRCLGYLTFDFAVTEAEAVAAALARCPDLIRADSRLPLGCGAGAVGWEVRERMRDAIIVRKPIDADELVCAVAESRRAA